jgi:hypothetical protein
MLTVWDSLFCQLFHSSFSVVVSYSQQGSYRCSKPGCRAQRRHDAQLAVAPPGRTEAVAPTDVHAPAVTPQAATERAAAARKLAADAIGPTAA